MLQAVALGAAALAPGTHQTHHGARLIPDAPSTVTATAAADAPKKKPNILLMLTDDVGWGAMGYHRNMTYGSLNVPANPEIITPNFDRLVKEGVELDRHYAAPFCAHSAEYATQHAATDAARQ